MRIRSAKLEPAASCSSQSLALRCARYFSGRGFSLIELLMVIAIMAMLTGLLVPTISSFSSTYNRKRATSVLMETLELARLTALQSGEKVTVIFAKATSPEGEDAVIVTGRPPLGSITSSQVVNSRWVKLPAGVRFRSAANTLGTSSLPDGGVLTGLPPLAGAPTFSCVVFNSAGQVEHPADRPLKLALFEGQRQGSQDLPRGASLVADGPCEIISLARFTGRAQFNTGSL